MIIGYASHTLTKEVFPMMRDTKEALAHAKNRIGPQCSYWVDKVQGRGSKINIRHKVTGDVIVWRNCRSQWNPETLENSLSHNANMLIMPSSKDLKVAVKERDKSLSDLAVYMADMQKAINEKSDLEKVEDLISSMEDSLRELYRSVNTVNDIEEVLNGKR